MDLCEFCVIFDIHKCNDSIKGWPFRDVKNSAERGCKFCSLICCELWARYPTLEVDLGLKNTFLYYDAISQDLTGLSQSHEARVGYQYSLMTVRVMHLKCRWKSDPIVFSLLADSDSQAAMSGDIAVAYVENDSKSPKHFNLLRKWLSDCQQNHPRCNQLIGNDFVDYQHCPVPLPSRLIDVGAGTGPTVQLQDTAGDKGSYMTLSHCWGTDSNHPVPRTTSKNLEQQRNGIEIASLPRTFQDAITIARQLNIRYIWIDSLCIIQDNSDDWRYEASQMARIYKYSTLTVAATGAEDSSQGCFFAREADPTLQTKLVRLPYYTKNGTRSGNFFVCHRKQEIHEEIHGMLEDSPLLKRGWVFQERLLSRRIVHYTRRKIVFECQSHAPITECNETYVEMGALSSSSKLQREHDIEAYTKFNIKSSLSYFRVRDESDWYAIVEQYSKLALTRACEDKLVAISGIARELQLQYSIANNKAGKGPQLCNYTSGFWLHDLILRLSWQVARFEDVKDAGNYGPSWSWASLDCPVFWPRLLLGGKEEADFQGKKRTIKCNVLEPNPASGLPKISRYSKGESQYSLASALTQTSSSATLLPEIRQSQTMEFVTILKIAGRVRPVWRREISLNAVEQRDFEDACAFPRKSWLRGCHGIYNSAKDPDIIGWGSFEDDVLVKNGVLAQCFAKQEISSDVVESRLVKADRVMGTSLKSPSQQNGTTISCLLLSSYRVDGGWEHGFLGSAHKVYDVLYLRRVGESTYRRIGTGRVVEKGFFKNVEKTIVTLV